jgi:hypothetical protein
MSIHAPCNDPLCPDHGIAFDHDPDGPHDRLVSTGDGLAVLMAGGSLEDALAADDRFAVEAEARNAADAVRREGEAEKLRLDLMERKVRIRQRIERHRRRSGGSGAVGDTDTHETP